MPLTNEDLSPDELLRRIGPDSTATFDNSPSNPTEHASSEATNAATAVPGEDFDTDDDEDEDLEDKDDDAANLEYDDELDEEEDVEDEAGT